MNKKREIQLDPIFLFLVPQTCQEYADMGITRSGPFLIDPDGAGIQEPAFKVNCDMETGKPPLISFTFNRMNVIFYIRFIYRINDNKSRFGGRINGWTLPRPRLLF